MTAQNGLQTPELVDRLLVQASKFDLAGQDCVEIACALGFVMRSVHLLAVSRLTQIATEFPAYVQSLLTAQAPDERLARATFETQDCLSFLELIDMLSVSELDCIAPRLHRGWQDKTQSCRRARQVATNEFGFRLDAEQRRTAIAAQSIYNGIFVMPPPADPDTTHFANIFALLLELIEGLAPRSEIERLSESLTSLRGPVSKRPARKRE